MILITDIDSQIPRLVSPGRRPRLVGAILITLAVLCVGVAALTPLLGFASVLGAPASAELVIVAAVPTNGVIAFTIPRGATDVQQAGGRAYIMPAAMRFKLGDKLIVHNDDLYPHMIFTRLVMPGTTETMTFNEPGIYPYSSGCAAHGGMLNAFTSVIVSRHLKN